MDLDRIYLRHIHFYNTIHNFFFLCFLFGIFCMSETKNLLSFYRQKLSNNNIFVVCNFERSFDLRLILYVLLLYCITIIIFRFIFIWFSRRLDTVRQYAIIVYRVCARLCILNICGSTFFLFILSLYLMTSKALKRVFLEFDSRTFISAC